jgi:hypothetical protein
MSHPTHFLTTLGLLESREGADVMIVCGLKSWSVHKILPNPRFADCLARALTHAATKHQAMALMNPS